MAAAKKLFSYNPKGTCYHPMIIRFCLSLASKSKSSYEELRNSSILVLPSSRTLRDYKNAIAPQTGYRKQIIDDLNKLTKDYFDIQRYVCLLIDKMKIKSNLVFDKHSGELIGYLDLEELEKNFTTIEEENNTLATRALVLYLRGIGTNLKYSFAYFATNGVTSGQLLPLFLEAVAILELSFNLWVIAVTSDGASPYRRFYRMHKNLHNDNTDICFKTINLYARYRNIYFIGDAPHLMKTVRNCSQNSDGGKHSQYMWNDEKYLLWEHIVKIYHEDSENGLKILQKISNEHVYHNSYSVMTVKYAVQVLSKTMLIAVSQYGSPDTSETARFYYMINNFFDFLNVRSTTEAVKKRNNFLQPYSNVDVQRLQWLGNTFLNYLNEWKENIKARRENFTKIETAQMFISWQTYEGVSVCVLNVCPSF